jgi:hypothetical protein
MNTLACRYSLFVEALKYQKSLNSGISPKTILKCQNVGILMPKCRYFDTQNGSILTLKYKYFDTKTQVF